VITPSAQEDILMVASTQTAVILAELAEDTPRSQSTPSQSGDRLHTTILQMGDISMNAAVQPSETDQEGQGDNVNLEASGFCVEEMCLKVNCMQHMCFTCKLHSKKLFYSF